jgi:hypothetical protein
MARILSLVKTLLKYAPILIAAWAAYRQIQKKAAA